MQIYSDQLAQCQRYYEYGSFGNGGYAVNGIFVGTSAFFKITKRVAPTMVLAPFSYTNASGASASNTTTDQTQLSATCSGTGGYQIYINWTAASEL
jgi:hypothetical protein